MHSGLLQAFDAVIRESLCTITNVAITDQMWTQASLPISEGGLGIHSIEKLALPAFLASAYSIATLASETADFHPDEKWDEPLIAEAVEMLRVEAQDDLSSQARLRGVRTKENGAWLEALPAASFGNLLTDSALRIAVGLRLGAAIITPHRCICGDWVDARGYHGLSCKKSRGRKPRHSSLNAVCKRAFASAGIETELEPVGLCRTNGQRPVTLAPWERGRMLTWDVTCVCTVALSHIVATSERAGAAAAKAEQDKVTKYQNITPDYLFSALGFETLGPNGPEGSRLLTEVGRRVRQETGEARAPEYLRQRISIEIQRGNAASVQGTAPPGANLDQLFSVLRPPEAVFC
ncbi:uncharacterized protein LOC129597488 [Paramacrobiotus metropolitanus]|uniref:uncharacterized protein LOC129597488 n=1 Tax=Paramacrobiotus metropolitanus TaxID=2943436 RepID=UPI0024460B59|nr:uncharacterized protein LOC129597488 [Paramacrobiotus metropolitanus]